MPSTGLTPRQHALFATLAAVLLFAGPIWIPALHLDGPDVPVRTGSRSRRRDRSGLRERVRRPAAHDEPEAPRTPIRTEGGTYYRVYLADRRRPILGNGWTETP